jgi:hypothetical protein
MDTTGNEEYNLRITKIYDYIRLLPDDYENGLQKLIIKTNKFADSVVEYFYPTGNYLFIGIILSIIKTKYCVSIALKYNINNKYIYPLFYKFCDLKKVNTYIFKQFKKKNYNIELLDILLKGLDDKQNRDNICTIFKIFYKAKNEENQLCKIINMLINYTNETSVIEIINLALESNIKNLIIYTKILLNNFNYNELKKNIDSNFLLELAKKQLYSEILLYCIENTKIILIIENYYKDIQQSILNNFNKKRNDCRNFCLYQNYFDELLCIGLIGNFTNNKNIFLDIFNFIKENIDNDTYKCKYFKGDKITAQSIYYSLSKNIKYGNLVKKDLTVYRNSILFKYSLLDKEYILSEVKLLFIKHLRNNIKKDKKNKIFYNLLIEKYQTI